MNSKNNSKLSLLAQFDDLNRMMGSLLAEENEKDNKIKTLLENFNNQRILWLIERNELLQSTELAQNQAKEINSLKTTLKNVREAYKKELNSKEQIVSERDLLVNKLTQVQNYLKEDDDDQISKDSKTSLKDLVSSLNLHKLTTVIEENSSDHSISDIEFDKTDEDNLDDDNVQINKKIDLNENVDDEIKTTNAVFEDEVNFEDFSILNDTIIDCLPNLQKNTPSTKSKASVQSKLSALSQTLMKQRQSTLPNEIKINNRAHQFATKKIYKILFNCCVCTISFGFNSTAFYCKDCKAICHKDCKDKVPLPCIPFVSRPIINKQGRLVLISDFVKSNCKPCVPALIVHCVNEIESRGLDEIGIYRIPSSENEVKELKEKILKSKNGIPQLKNHNIHVLSNVIKKFLNHLDEPIITRISWRDFIEAYKLDNYDERKLRIKDAILSLPNANRDTLAFLMLHLRKVSSSKVNKMNNENLAKLFGPTLIGHTVLDPPMEQLQQELKKQHKLIEYLLNLDDEFWQLIIGFDQNNFNFSLMSPGNQSILSYVSPDQKSSKKGRPSIGSRLCGGKVDSGTMTPLKTKAKPNRHFYFKSLF